MQRTYKYRIYPNRRQREALARIFDFCRFLYNSALEERINFYKTTKKSRSYVDQANMLPEVRKSFFEETSIIYAQTLQQILKQLDLAYKNFFRRVKNGEVPGFPRFKNIDRFRSICFPQVSPDLSKGCVSIKDNKLHIYGVSEGIKIKLHRPIQGIAKQCRIVKHPNGNFYLCITCKDVPQNILPKTGKTTGIDLGLENFVTLDDGTKFHHPKPYRTAKEKLAFHQRKLALKQKGSNNRKKQKRLVARTYEKITNITKDFQHKLANKMIEEYDEIIIENLNIKNMLEEKGFAVSKANISEASWNKFKQKLFYKAESAGKKVILVNPRNTSSTCSACGNIKEKLDLHERIYKCEACGFALDRDINAAINIKRLGMSLVDPKGSSEADVFKRR